MRSYQLALGGEPYVTQAEAREIAEERARRRHRDARKASVVHVEDARSRNLPACTVCFARKGSSCCFRPVGKGTRWELLGEGWVHARRVRKEC